VWVQVFDVVARVNRIDLSRRYRVYVGHGANYIGLGRVVNVQTHFEPNGRVGATGRSAFVLRIAADVKKGFQMGFCLKALDALRKNPTPL
jgi:hypothetical protein